MSIHTIGVLSLFMIMIDVCAFDALTIHRYIWANYQEVAGNLADAHNWYSLIFTSNYSTYTHKGYLHFLFKTKQYKRIVELIPQLEDTFKNSADIQLIFILSLEKSNMLTKADERTIAISDRFKQNSEITMRAAQAYVRRKEPENALLTINAFLNSTAPRTHNFIFYFLMAQIYSQLNQLEKALEHCTICIELHNRFDKGWLLLASLHEQQNQIELALKGYDTFLALSSGNTIIAKHRNDLLKRYTTLTMPANNPYNKSYLEQALTLYAQKDYSHAIVLVNKYIEQHPDNYEAQLLHIKLLAALNRYNDIGTQVVTWMSHEPDEQVCPKAVHLLSYSHANLEQISAILHELSQQYPQNYWYILYNVDLYLRMQRPEEVLIMLEKALPLIKDINLQAKICYQISLLHYNNHRYTDMRVALEKGYALQPDMPHITNGLAYYWAKQKNDLEKAEYYSNKSLAMHPSNPYFLDTKAYILYKQKKYTEAESILKGIEHNSAPIFLHLAQVYYKLDNHKEALMYAQKSASENITVKEREKVNKLQVLCAMTETMNNTYE